MSGLHDGHFANRMSPQRCSFLLLSHPPPITCCPVSSRVSVPGGFLSVCILRAGPSLPQPTQPEALFSPCAPCSWVAVPANSERCCGNPSRLLPEATLPWVDQALSCQCCPFLGPATSRGGQRVLGAAGTTDPIHSFPTMGK